MWPFKKGKIIDLTGNVTSIKSGNLKKSLLASSYKNPEISSKESAEISPLGFLGNLADSASTSSENSDSLGVKHLKVKIDDLEYKMQSLSKRLSMILDRLDLAEKKIGRVEGRN